MVEERINIIKIVIKRRDLCRCATKKSPKAIMSNLMKKLLEEALAHFRVETQFQIGPHRRKEVEA